MRFSLAPPDDVGLWTHHLGEIEDQTVYICVVFGAFTALRAIDRSCKPMARLKKYRSEIQLHRAFRLRKEKRLAMKPESALSDVSGRANPHRSDREVASDSRFVTKFWEQERTKSFVLNMGQTNVR